MASKQVSKKYALNEFNTIGLVLIIYCLLVLFIPFVVRELLGLLFEDTVFYGVDLVMASQVALMIIGTILPFMLLRKSTKRRDLPITKKIKMSGKQIICQAIVFFTLTSVAIFAMTTIAANFGISGELVSCIGISIDSNRLGDVLYIVTFILISPILEEYAFRGVLLSTLSKYGKYFALYASAFIFSLAHGSFMEFVPSFIMGVILGKIALRYKSIKPTIWIHILFNALLYVSFIIPENMSIYMAGFFGAIYVSAIALYLTGVYRPIIVRKSNSNAKVTIMFLTTFSVLVSITLFIASSILTMLLR